MRKFANALVVLLLIHCSLFAKPALTVWIRSFGEKSAQIVVPYVKQVEEELSTDFELCVFVATKPNDPVLNALEEMGNDDYLSVLQTNLGSFSQGLNDLVQTTPADCYVLSLSQGVDISAKDVMDAIALLKGEAWVHGWQLSNLSNDGSMPGKGWYHTAALYPPKTISWMKTHPFPNWIDNGVDGFVLVDGESIPIGGNEEVALMGMVLQNFPNAIFLHNIRDILNFSSETGTHISFEQKLKRKVAVAEYYLKTRLQMEPQEVWNHLFLISD